MKFTKTVLDNGLRIITAPQKDNPAVTVLVLVETGSKYETKDINGISHFLEHMCFKGTKKRPKAIDIATELDEIGASYNAFTGFEVTGYYAKVDKTHFETALDVVSDIYLSQVFDPEEIEKEKGPVIEEINLFQDTPTRQIPYNLMRLLYGDQPAGWDVAGTKELVRRLTRDDLIKYKQEHYLSSATTVIIAGAIDEKDALEKTEEAFKDIPVGKKKGKLPIKESQTKPGLLVENKPFDQTHMLFGMRGYSLFDERRYAAGVLTDILGAGMSSRLFQRVREKLGAVYHISARSNLLTDHGYLSIYAGVDNKRREEVIRAILEECKWFKDEKVGEKELKKSKNHMVGSMMLSLETSDSIADFYGEQEIFAGKILQPDEIAEKIHAVTAEQIKEVANDILTNEKLNLAIIGPVEDEKALREVLKIA